MTARKARLDRKTKETRISLELDLDGTGDVQIETGVGFFDHMLSQLGHHSRMNLAVKAQGDTHIDDHHTVEDVGILLGMALKEALGDKSGIRRFGSSAVPLDDALARVDLDISGRGGFFLRGEFPREKCGSFDSFLAGDFFQALAQNAGITLHMELVSGTSPHHIVESAFKSTAAALRAALAVDERMKGVPSTKGVL